MIGNAAGDTTENRPLLAPGQFGQTVRGELTRFGRRTQTCWHGIGFAGPWSIRRGYRGLKGLRLGPPWLTGGGGGGRFRAFP